MRDWREEVGDGVIATDLTVVFVLHRDSSLSLHGLVIAQVDFLSSRGCSYFSPFTQWWRYGE